MFIELILNSVFNTILMLLLLIVYWYFLDFKLDHRIFISLNFSLVSIWVINSNFTFLSFFCIFFIVLFILTYKLSPVKLIKQKDTFKQLDLSLILILICIIQIYLNLTSIATILTEKNLLLEQNSENQSLRFLNYILAVSGLLTAHVICSSYLYSWSAYNKLAVFLSIVASGSGLSKASFLPVLMVLFFIYFRKIKLSYYVIILFIVIPLYFYLTQKILDGISFIDIWHLMSIRLLNNMDSLNYISALGQDLSSEYPFRSIFFLFWPFFQLFQENFISPGVWLHGTLYNDWRGYGPNPTFVVDFIIASDYVGVLLAIVLGFSLKFFNNSIFRIQVALIIFNAMQDWYGALMTTGLYLLIFFFYKFIPKFSLR